MRRLWATVLILVALGGLAAAQPLPVPTPSCVTDEAAKLITCAAAVDIAGPGTYFVSGRAVSAGREAAFGPVAIPICGEPDIQRTDTTIEIRWSCPAGSAMGFGVTRQ